MDIMAVLAMIGTIAIIYGGGQIPTANLVTGKLGEKLIQKGAKVYGVHKSFLGMLDQFCYEKFTLQKTREIQIQLGTYLSMCRNVDPSKEPWFTDIVKRLNEFVINTLFIIGGDGSSRAARELLLKMQQVERKIRIIFIPCTIDGIPNSESIGFDSAVAESFRHVCAMIVNAFATWNPNYDLPRIPIIEIQGRNRNDIAVGVMKKIIDCGKIGKYCINEFNIIFIPSAYSWSYKELLKNLYVSDTKTAIIAAEGAVPIETDWNTIPVKGVGQKLENLIKADAVRECNLDIVGYLSQTNDSITETEIQKIEDWVSFAVNFLFEHAETEDSFAIIKNKNEFSAMPIKEFADATDSKNAIPLTEEEYKEFEKYLP